MENYIKCNKCGGDEFIRIMAIPKISPSPKLEERKIVCYKCNDELTAEEVDEQLQEKEE